MGLTKRSPDLPHRIDFGKERPVISLGRLSPSRSTVLLPCRRRTAQTYSPLSVATVSRSSTSTPCAWANPLAARVGRPLSSKAACFGGPSLLSTASFWNSSTSPTQTTRRLGVPIDRICPKSTSRDSSSPRIDSSRSLRALGVRPAGISSAPISRSNSFAIVTPGPSRRVASLRRLCSKPVQKGIPHGLPLIEICRSAPACQISHPMDKTGPLGHAYGSTSIENVEDV